MPHISAVAALALGLAAQSPEPVDPGTSYWFRVPAPVAPGIRAALERRFDCLCGPRDPQGDLQIIVSPQERDAFLRLAPGNTVLVRRGEPFAQRVGPAVPDAGYFTTAEILAEMNALVAAYPTLAKLVDLTTLPGAARTHGNNSIWALKVSDNIATDELEPAVVIAAQHHARELNSTYMVIGAMRRVLQTYASDPVIAQVVNDKELWFVPCVNPDGTNHVWSTDDLWRKNRRNNGTSFGVDNNRNYDVMWTSACAGSATGSSETYKGPSPLSEPENRTLLALNKAVRPEFYIDFHSYGREVLFPYSTCATVAPTLRTFLDRYVADLRTPMSYGTRAPSASSEAPEQFWVESGTLSFLVEVMTSFQPAFTSVVTEEQNLVWPGLRRALTTWRPGMRGVVRSITGQPVEATITYSPNLFNLGERSVSRGRDGLYKVWLPLGTHQVTFAATGYQSVTVPVTVTAYDQPVALDICMQPTSSVPTLAKSGTDRIGTITSLTYTSAGDAGAGYLLALALGATPGIPVGCGRTLPLNGDALFLASVQPGSPILNGIGTLPGSAQVAAQLVIPPIAALAGLTVYVGGVTTADDFPLSVKKFSASLPITFQL